MATPAVPPVEALQSLILSTLDSDGSIPDSRQLRYNGVPLASSDEQAVVKSALDSLWSREV